MTNENQPKQRRKWNIIGRILALLVTAALVLGALMLVIYRDRFNLDALERWLAYRNLETGETGQAAPFTHAGGDKLTVAYLDNGVLLSSATGAHYYSFSGEKYAEEVLDMDNPVLSASAKAGVVYDAGGQSLFLFRRGEKSFDLTLDGAADLLSARVNDNGWLAVTAQQSGYKGSVTVYNTNGEKIIQISLSSTFLVDAAVSPDNKTVAVVVMDQLAGQFRSRVLFYPVDRDTPSAEADLGSVTVLELDYEKDALWVLAEDRLITVSPNGSELGTYSFGSTYLKGCSLGGDGFALLLTGRYRAGTADRALTVGADGNLLHALTLTTPALDFSAAGDYCSVLSGSQLTVYDRMGQVYAMLDATQGARYTALSANGSSLLANTQQAWLYIPD